MAQVRHTLRAGNTMADYLANKAMDSRFSHYSDTTWTPTDEHLTRLLRNDTAHPHTILTDQPTMNLLDLTHQTIQRYAPNDTPPGDYEPA
jgi:hypothetical protein